MIQASAIIIGDELLSGAVQDTNTPLLIDRLYRKGIQLARVVTLADDFEAIAAEINRARATFDIVITSGGIGPTHDDRTMEAIARALGRPLFQHPQLVEKLRAKFGSDLNRWTLRLAQMPEGSRLIGDSSWPPINCENIYILPGVPSIFQRQLEIISDEFQGEAPVLHCLYLKGYESIFAPVLAEVENAFHSVKIGSYPQQAADHDIRISIQSEVPCDADQALHDLQQRISAENVVRIQCNADHDVTP